MLIMAPQKLKMPSNTFPAGDNTQYIEDVQRLRVSQLKAPTLCHINRGKCSYKVNLFKAYNKR
jgi:hypothetical protein